MTGTCDVLPVEAQLKLIRSFLPDAKKIGILYTTSETNSESQLKLYQDLAGATALRSWRRAFPPARTFLWRATPSCLRWIA